MEGRASHKLKIFQNFVQIGNLLGLFSLPLLESFGKCEIGLNGLSPKNLGFSVLFSQAFN